MQPYQNEENKQLIDLTNICYEVSGEGEPIVFLHGWGMNHTMMIPLSKELVKDNQVILLDLFGFGNSKSLCGYNSFDDYIEAFHQFLVSLNIHDPIIVAHSFGARVAILYASKYPVKALVLTGAAGIKASLSFKKKLRVFLHKHHLIQNVGSIDYQKADSFLRKVLVECVNTDLSEDISKIQVPILLIWGEKDTETPLWMADRIIKINTHATLIIFKGEDHFAYYHEPMRFVECTRMFLEAL